MLYLSNLEEAQKVIRALSAPMRMEIMKIIYRTPGVSMNYLAKTLELTNSAVSMHVVRESLSTPLRQNIKAEER